MTEIIALIVVAPGIGLAAYTVTSRSNRRRAEVAARNAVQALQNLTALERAAPGLLRDEYVTQPEGEAGKRVNSAALRAAQQVQLANFLDTKDASRYCTLAHPLVDLERATWDQNQAFVQRRMLEDSSRFDRIDCYPLTPVQHEA